jgi:hypothetical protein
LDAFARVDLMREVRRLVWRQYRRWFGPAVVLVFIAAGAVSAFGSWYDANVLSSGLGALIVGIIGVVAGRLSAPEGVRARYYDLIWASALASRVSAMTLLLEELFPKRAR